MNTDMLVEYLREKYPEVINDKEIVINDKGASNCIIGVDDKWIFKFPKTKYEEEQTELQLKILPKLELPIRIPEFDYFSKPEDPYPFVGYKKIPGSSLPHRATVVTENMTRSLGEFLSALHSFKWQTYFPIKDYMLEIRQNWVFRYSLVKEQCMPLLEPEIQSWALESFEGFLESQKNFASSLCLLHGDFKRGNIIYDGKDKITGVVDFGSMGIGEPALEFASLHFDYGFSFTYKLLEFYKLTTDSNFLQRIKFYCLYGVLNQLLYGVVTSDNDTITKGIECLLRLYNEKGI